VTTHCHRLRQRSPGPCTQTVVAECLASRERLQASVKHQLHEMPQKLQSFDAHVALLEKSRAVIALRFQRFFSSAVAQLQALEKQWAQELTQTTAERQHLVKEARKTYQVRAHAPRRAASDKQCTCWAGGAGRAEPPDDHS
jgi:hypothetical protein